MPSTIEQIKKYKEDQAAAIEGIDAGPIESEKEEAGEDESDLARMSREAEESAKKQEASMHKKNVRVGGVDSGRL